MPPNVQLPNARGQLRFTSKLPENDSAHASSGKNRPALLIYTAEVQMQQPDAISSSSGPAADSIEVVVKVPGNDSLFQKEVR